MGTDLRQVLCAFEHLIEPASLVDRKLLTNRWEQEYWGLHAGAEPRPLNLDPGYLTEAKLILASTKDRDHRIYLDRGIFAENTLYFHAGLAKTSLDLSRLSAGGLSSVLDRCRQYYRSENATRERTVRGVGR